MCEHPSPSTAKSKLPGMTYTHLTRDERYQIAILVKAGHDQSKIAEVMNRHRSTISRELRRNRGQRGYRPKQAHELPMKPGLLSMSGSVSCGALNRSAADLKSAACPRSATRASTAASMPTSVVAARSTAPCVVRKREENATGVANGAAPSPTRYRLISAQLSWICGGYFTTFVQSVTKSIHRQLIAAGRRLGTPKSAK